MSTPLHSHPPAVPSDGSSSPSSTPSEASSSIIRPEWVPLDEVAETWADFSGGVAHAHGLQAVGNAFLALSFEMSAHRHYTQAYHGLWRLSPAVVAQGLAEAIGALRETCQQWVCAYQWLERYANEERHDQEQMTAIRELFSSIAAQQQRLWLLLARVQEEQYTLQRESSLMVPLGHLSASAAMAVKETGVLS